MANEITISKTLGIEFVARQLVKFAIDPNPIVAILNAIWDGSDTLQRNNIVDVMNDLKTRVEYIEEILQVKLRFDTPIFTDDILPVLQKAKNEFNSQKRQLYATFIVACIHPDNLNCSNKVIFSNYLDRLDYLSIYILNNIKSYCTERQLIEIIDSKEDKDTILVHLWNLKSLDLVESITADEYEKSSRFGNRRLLNSKNVLLYKRSNLGNEFLNFMLKGIPENDSTHVTYSL